jgi:hypothetical protein
MLQENCTPFFLGACTSRFAVVRIMFCLSPVLAGSSFVVDVGEAESEGKAL